MKKGGVGSGQFAVGSLQLAVGSWGVGGLGSGGAVEKKVVS
ncbi:MAG: hypothetical protein ACMV0Y_08430 [Paludibacter sp.]